MLLAGECFIESPIFNPIAMFAEVDLFHKWMPALDNVTELKRITKFRRLLHYTVRMPLFFTNRDIVCSAVGNIDHKRKAVVFTLKGMESGTYFGTPVPGSGKHVRVDLKMCAAGFEYMNEKLCRFRLVLQADPKMMLIPMTLINWGTKMVIFELLKIMMKKASKLDPVYVKRIQENDQGLYSEIRDRLSELHLFSITLPE